ncbi:MAG: hypothetical protein FJZ75_01995 [Bacteroidetes bacterium]|nr:hypothetical protein [Bacteroidota bacterium]
MKRIILMLAFFCWLNGIGQFQPLKGIWRQPELGLTLQLEQHGQYAFGKVVEIGKLKREGALKFDDLIRPGHFALTELRFIRPGIWLGLWNSGDKRTADKRILLKSISPDSWQLYCKRGPLWMKIKDGKFVPEK